MFVHEEELKILELYRRNIFAEHTIREIMELLNKKSYNWTYKAVHNLQPLLKIKKRGNTKTITADLNNYELITYLTLLDRKEAKEKTPEITGRLIKSINKKTPQFILMLTGSYARGTQDKHSDIDIAIITDKTEKEIEPYIKEVRRFSDKNIETHIFSHQDFYNMLVANTENFGKEVFRNHITCYGAEAYYSIVRETIKDGLQEKI